MSVIFTTEAREQAQDLIADALHEDLAGVGDLTCDALIDPAETGSIQIVARAAGVLAGLPVVALVFEALEGEVAFKPRLEDGADLQPGAIVAEVAGPLRTLLIGERTALNFLCHLSGVATLTRRYVAAAANPQVAILDTRKTLPGWRRLQKYAVALGGGTNHRMGLFDGVLIKDNHLAAWSRHQGDASIAAAVRKARESAPQDTTIEVEVDTLTQLEDALHGGPDVVLLDNMSLADLKTAVALRDERAPSVLLEASGGVHLDTVGPIAATGVDRISIGALTHSAPALDLAFDWSA
jgi:nicotinate-nucleotide pyrophosphorylase (carboxylating)